MQMNAQAQAQLFCVRVCLNGEENWENEEKEKEKMQISFIVSIFFH